MKRQHSDQFRHLPLTSIRLSADAQKARRNAVTGGVNCLAFSVVMQNGHMATLSKFDVNRIEISVVVSWDKDRQLAKHFRYEQQ